MSTLPFIRPAGEQDIDSICELLHAKMNRRIPVKTWHSLMEYSWLKDKPDLGRVIESNGCILGFLGMVYADRKIAHRHHRVVNICAWYLHKSLRGMGLGKGIMLDATSDTSNSYTIMTSSKNTVGLLDDIGYKILDDSCYIWRANGPAPSGFTVELNPKRIIGQIDCGLKRLVADHIGLPVTPMLFKVEDKQCLLIFSIKKKFQAVTYFDVLFTSNREFLGRFGQQIANLVLTEQPSVLAADCRFVKGPATHATVKKLPVPRFYKTDHLKPPYFDHLYSELQLLDLKLDSPELCLTNP